MFSLKNESRATKVSLAVILALFFSVTIFTIFKYGNSTLLGSLETYNNDDVKYIRSASTLLSTGKLTYQNPANATVFIMPGLPYVLAVFMRIFGTLEGVVAFRVFQAVLQTLSLLLVFFIGRKVFNSKVGLLAALLNAFYIAEIWVSNIILTEAIFKFLFLVLIYFCLYAVEKKKLSYYILGGIFWGLSAMFRPPVAAFPIVILIMWIKNKYKFSEIIKYTLVVSMVFAAIMSPWWIRNYRVFNKFIPFTMSSGNPMLQGTYVNYNRKDGSDNYIDKSQFKYTGDELGNDAAEKGIGKLRIKTLFPKEPLKYTYWYTIGKSIHLWNAPFYWIPILGVGLAPAKAYHLILVLLSIVSLYFYFKKRERYSSSSLLGYSIAYMNCIYLPFFCFSRYSYPVMPLVFIFSSYTILEIREKLKTKKTVRLRLSN